jgi:hypothetical protein
VTVVRRGRRCIRANIDYAHFVGFHSHASNFRRQGLNQLNCTSSEVKEDFGLFRPFFKTDRLNSYVPKCLAFPAFGYFFGVSSGDRVSQ